MNEAGHDARALVKKVGVEAFGAQPRDARRQFTSLGLGTGKVGGGIVDPLMQLHPGQGTAIALERVACEIEHQQCTEGGADDMPGAAA